MANSRAAIWLSWAAGAVELLLLARVTLRLLAARPDNPAFALLYALSDPLVAPFAPLDRGLPPFGAIFERSTLLLAIIVPALAYGAWVWLHGRATGRGASSS